MPILIKDVTWNQSEEELTIVLKFNAPKGAHTDVFTSKNYIKVHCSPYFWEAFLLHPIDKEESRCKICPGVVKFHLKKHDIMQWAQMEQVLSNEEKTTIRDDAIKESQEGSQKRLKDLAHFKEAKKREEILNATSRDASVRDEYEKMLKTAIASHVSSTVSNPGEIKGEESKKTSVKAKPVQPKPRPKSESIPKPEPAIPNIRKPGNISISFSERRFITPKRESQAEEEREWLLKQKDVRKTIGFVEEDLRPEERDPKWLKEKGDQFFEQKNYLAAISAYSTAIRLTDQYWELFLNRSAAHFQAGNYQKCVSA